MSRPTSKVVKLGKSNHSKEISINDITITTDTPANSETSSVVSDTSYLNKSSFKYKNTNFIKELKDKIENVKVENNSFISGKSDEHEIPAFSSGIVSVEIGEDITNKIPMVSIECAESGLLSSVVSSDDCNVLNVLVDNLTDTDKLFKIIYVFVC